MPRKKKVSTELVVREEAIGYRTKLDIENSRICECKPTHINCMTAKEWLKSQLGIWEF